MGLERISIAVLIGACGFNASPGENGPIDAPRPTDAVDARTGCDPGEPVCAGLALGMCNAAGTGIEPSAAMRDCTLACVDAPQPHCAAASNVPEPAQATCIATPGPALAPPAGATVTIGTASISCSPHCGAVGLTAISRIGSITQGSAPPVSWYCFGSVTLLAGTTVTASANVIDAIVWVATGPVVIDGVIDLDGGDGAQTSTGKAGPGGTDGGDLGDFSGDGVAALGRCGGPGGKTGTTSQNGSGGGGGGHGGGGGGGGDSMSASNITSGGAGSLPGCGVQALAPLTGGAGGGGGGDGNCGATGRCGFPGGGGGGAIQISGRRGITMTGTIHARGGRGYGDPGVAALVHAGAGGGAAGGGILLESWNVQLGTSAVLDVGGGNGGPSGSGSGGLGATTSSTGGDGPDATIDNTGGAGGGGGAGIVRLNAPGGSCVRAVPSASCTTGAPPASP